MAIDRRNIANMMTNSMVEESYERDTVSVIVFC